MENFLKHPLKKISLPDRVYERLKTDILERRWKNALPGARALALELDVSRNSILAAIERLKKENLLFNAGNGHALRIADSRRRTAGRRRFDVAILTLTPLHELSCEEKIFALSILREVENAGFVGKFPSPPAAAKNNSAVAKTWLRRQDADILIPIMFSEELLKFLLAGTAPVLAAGGATRNLEIAAVGNDYSVPVQHMIRRLAQLGHRRIVNIVFPWILDVPASGLARTIREELTAVGIAPSEYHLPHWEETGAGLEALLESLFKVTPPTALVVWNANMLAGVLQFLANRRLRIPEDVSLVAFVADDVISWSFPGMTVCCAKQNDEKFFAALGRKLREIARGKNKKERRLIPAIFIDGETIGPAPKRS